MSQYPRELNGHKINPCSDAITLRADDVNPKNGNASHRYIAERADPPGWSCSIDFQDGPIGEVGVNGVTQEVLLAILIDRIQGFQSGPYACRENAIALTKLQEAQHWLFHRTRERMERGVEGTHQK